MRNTKKQRMKRWKTAGPLQASWPCWFKRVQSNQKQHCLSRSVDVTDCRRLLLLNCLLPWYARCLFKAQSRFHKPLAWSKLCVCGKKPKWWQFNLDLRLVKESLVRKIPSYGQMSRQLQFCHHVSSCRHVNHSHIMPGTHEVTGEHSRARNPAFFSAKWLLENRRQIVHRTVARARFALANVKNWRRQSTFERWGRQHLQRELDFT